MLTKLEITIIVSLGMMYKVLCITTGQVHNFKKLNIWIESKDLSIEIYRISKAFPREELYGLTNQLRRAIVSVPANISEGAGRLSKKDFAHFINIALGSLNEVYTFTEISLDLKYIEKSQYNLVVEKIERLQNMLYKFNKSLRT